MALEISGLSVGVAPNVLTIGSISVEVELNKPIINYISVEERTIIIDTVSLEDTISNVNTPFQVYNAILRDSTGVENSLALTFQPDSLTSDTVNAPFNVSPENVRIDFYIDAVIEGESITDIRTDITPVVLGV